MNIAWEKTASLANEERVFLSHRGVGANIPPPLRILNSRHVFLGGNAGIREDCSINGFETLPVLLEKFGSKHGSDFEPDEFHRGLPVEYEGVCAPIGDSRTRMSIAGP